MVRKATQLLILPVLFFLLAAGGKATLCDVLSVVGLQGHHHASDDGHGAGALCLDSHEHHHEESPCPEACEIRISEATAPIVQKVPALAEVYLLPSLLDALLTDTVPGNFLRAVENLEPPDRVVSLIDPMFTGRFLV